MTWRATPLESTAAARRSGARRRGQRRTDDAIAGGARAGAARAPFHGSPLPRASGTQPAPLKTRQQPASRPAATQSGTHAGAARAAPQRPRKTGPLPRCAAGPLRRPLQAGRQRAGAGRRVRSENHQHTRVVLACKASQLALLTRACRQWEVWRGAGTAVGSAGRCKLSAIGETRVAAHARMPAHGGVHTRAPCSGSASRRSHAGTQPAWKDGRARHSPTSSPSFSTSYSSSSASAARTQEGSPWLSPSIGRSQSSCSTAWTQREHSAGMAWTVAGSTSAHAVPIHAAVPANATRNSSGL
mgnify:CR=1 FL=1